MTAGMIWQLSYIQCEIVDTEKTGYLKMIVEF